MHLLRSVARFTPAADKNKCHHEKRLNWSVGILWYPSRLVALRSATVAKKSCAVVIRRSQRNHSDWVYPITGFKLSLSLSLVTEPKC